MSSVTPGDVFKRSLDVVLALLGLVLSAPIWPIAAAANRLQGDGPLFYEQARWGRDGTTFVVRKFRTMVPVSTDTEIRQAEPRDPRVTRVGRVLRAAGLDEVPQLLAILRGDMSFVGPRPLAVGERVRSGNGDLVPYEDVPGFRERLQVRPGLTGSATVFLPKDADPETKFSYDLRYIHERTMFGDLKLILLSLWISVRGRWERRDPKI